MKLIIGKLLTKCLIACSLFAFAFSAYADRKQNQGPAFWANNAWYNYYESSDDSKSYLDTWKGGFTLKHNKAGGDVIGAKGWGVGKYDRAVNYKVSKLDTSGQYYAAVYGWFKDYPADKNNGIVEYYVVEHHRDWKASSQQDIKYLGREWVNGGWYNYYVSYRYNEDHAFSKGKADFKQYWAIREDRRWSGKVTMNAHFYNWNKYGQKAKDQWGYQMFAVETYYSSGEAVVEVW